LSEHAEARTRLVHTVEFVDHHNRDDRACVPSRIYIDGMEITGALSHDPLGVPVRWAIQNHHGAMVVALSLYRGKTRVTPDVYGPGTYKVELLYHPEMPPIELCTPDFGDGTPPVTTVVDGGCLCEREVVQFYAESVHFRHARLAERTALMFIR